MAITELVAELEKSITLVDELKKRLDDAQVAVSRIGTEHANAIKHAQEIREAMDAELNKRLPSGQSARVR